MSPEEAKLSRQKLAIETRLKRADQQLARAQFESQKSKDTSGSGWRGLMTPTGGILVAATLGLVGTAFGKYFDNEIESKKQQTAIVLKASEVASSLSADEQKVVRANNLLWFAESKYLSLSDDVVAQLRKQAGLEKGQAIPAPTILPATAGSAVVPPRPNYSLDIPPKNAQQTNTAYKLLQLAVGEINKNVDRQNTPDRIMEYWRATTNQGVTIDASWAGAFITWLIKQAAPNQMEGSGFIPHLWSEAEKQQLVLRPDEKPLPGDIVVFRSGGMPNHVGVVYAIQGSDFTSIEGNAPNGIRQKDHKLDANILGFFRLKD